MALSFLTACCSVPAKPGPAAPMASPAGPIDELLAIPGTCVLDPNGAWFCTSPGTGRTLICERRKPCRWAGRNV